MTILGIAGSIGSGKSFTQLKAALQYCERKEKQLVTNFELNLSALYDYCKLANLPWCLRLVRRGHVSWIVNPKKNVRGELRPNLEALLIPESVVCLDEAGIFLNARDFARVSSDLLADLCQSRKTGTDLVWAAQFSEQVDKQFRMLTQYWIHCKSMAFYSKKLKRPRLFWKKIYWFTADDYCHWLMNIRDQTSHFKTRFAYSFQYEGGLLNQADRKLFDCFNSFSRLDYELPKDRIRLTFSSPLLLPSQVRQVDYLFPPSPHTPSPHTPHTHPRTQELGAGGGEHWVPPWSV